MSSSKNIICFGCGALVPDIESPTHEYMLSAPGCWSLYGKILAKEYTFENYDPDSHRITVDTYAVTHPGDKTERKAVQSVNIHLIRLFYLFEKNLKGKKLLQVIKNAADDEGLHRGFRWLEPPSFINTLHVTDILKAKDIDEHRKIVELWGKSGWSAWKNMHGNTIESLAKRVEI